MTPTCMSLESILYMLVVDGTLQPIVAFAEPKYLWQCFCMQLEMIIIRYDILLWFRDSSSKNVRVGTEAWIRDMHIYLCGYRISSGLAFLDINWLISD